MNTAELAQRLERYDTHLEWLQARTRGLGGSDMAAIIEGSGVYAMWLEKTGRAPIEDSTDVDYLEWGHYMERAIFPWYADRLIERDTLTARAYDDCLLRHPELPVHASPDILVFNRDDECIRGADAKNVANSTTADEWGRPGTDVIPTSALLQGVLYCAVFEVERWDFVPCIFGRPPGLYTVWRRPDVEDEVLGRAADWWDHHVVKGNEPEPDGDERTTKAIKRLVGSSATQALPETPQMRTLAERAARAKAEADAAKKEADAAINACRLATGDHEGVDGLWTYKTDARGVRRFTLDRALKEKKA